MIHHFEVLRACLNVLDHAHLKCLNQFEASPHTKNQLHTSLLRKLDIEDSCNLIGQEHFGS